MKVLGIIPARFASTRFPGKPLTPILNRPMILWVLEGANSSSRLENVLVATDSDEIAKVVKAAGGPVVMTHADLPSGTDRVWAAVADKEADLIINIQGDEPLIEGAVLDDLVAAMEQNPNWQMATLARPLSVGELENKDVVKVIFDSNDRAIYFSRFPIPYSRIDADHNKPVCWAHVGLYIYRKAFLEAFCARGPVELERAEALEQLRALEMGAPIGVVKTSAKFIGVDRPEDVKKVEKILESR